MLKELFNDKTIATSSQDTASIVAKTVQRLYFSVTPSSNNCDLDLVHVTVRIGEDTVIARYSLEQLGAIWCAENGGDPGSFAGGDQTGDTVVAVDLGQWPVPEGSKLYVEIDNSDAESQIFNVSAQVDETMPPNPLSYNKSDDGNFNVDNLIEVYAWDSNGTLNSSASYYQVAGRRVSVEQSWMATVAESPADFSGVTSFAVIHVNDGPLDMEIQNEQSGTITTLYVTQVENDDIQKATEQVLKPLVAKKIASFSPKNIRSMIRTQGGTVSPKLYSKPRS
jgi:hypothetical protein